MTWGPLGGGFFSGKYSPGERSLAGTRSEGGQVGNHFGPNADATLKVLLEVAKEAGKSPAQTAIRWILEQQHITSVLLGARTVAHFDDNVRATSWRMAEDALARLNEVSAPAPKYPERMEDPRDAQRLSAIDMPSLS